MINANIEDSDGEQKLKDKEMISHSITFLLAGYETTANALTYTSYLLALHPEIQEQLQKEIDEYFESNPVRNTIRKLSHNTGDSKVYFFFKLNYSQ